MSAAYSETASPLQSAPIVPLLPDRLRLPQMGVPTATGAAPVLLRNIGGKPLRFYGELLAEGSNRNEGASQWHELALYRTGVDQIAVALRLQRAGAEDIGVHRARLFADLDEAALWLEQFDCSKDLAADFDVADRSLSTISVSLKAASLRDRVERLDRAYRGLVGEILFRLATDF